MKRILPLFSAVLMLLYLAINVSPAIAAPAAKPSSVGSTGLSINPRKNLIIAPGQTIKDNLIVSNLSQTASLAISLRIVDFTFYNSSGTPKLFLAKNAPQTTWSLKPFLHLPSSEVLTPGQTLEVPYSVTVPKNQGAGSYYSAIEYAASSGKGNNVDLSASGVTLMFVTVPGTFHENLSLQKMGVYTPGSTAYSGSYTFINTQMPKQVAYTLKNSGNVAESPSGSATITYMFGGKSIVISNINTNSSLALLGQARLFTTCIAPVKQSLDVANSLATTQVCGPVHLKPGHYSINMSIYYGQNGNPTKEVVGTAGFWYLPWWFVVALVVVILIIAYIVWRITRKLQGKSSSVKKFRKR